MSFTTGQLFAPTGCIPPLKGLAVLVSCTSVRLLLVNRTAATRIYQSRSLFVMPSLSHYRFCIEEAVLYKKYFTLPIVWDN